MCPVVCARSRAASGPAGHPRGVLCPSGVQPDLLRAVVRNSDPIRGPNPMPMRIWLLTFAGTVSAASLLCPAYALKECAGAGRCEEFDGAHACVCDAGHAGIDCAVVLSCDPTASRLPCSGRGVCNAEGTCECADGYAGDLCEVDTWCPKNAVGVVCSGEVCSAHSCLCRPHRSGVACEQLATDARAIPAMP